MNYHSHNSEYMGDNRQMFYSGHNDESDPPSPASKLQPVQRDNMNRMWILRETLYDDPDLFHDFDSPQEDSPIDNTADIAPTYSVGYDWTKQQWQKAGNFQGTINQTCPAPQQTKQLGKQNKFLKNVMVSLSQPVKLSKAESMMQKMGWQGGALGKDGVGIVEPIAPNIAYATKTLGFGQEKKKKNPPPIKRNQKPKRARQMQMREKRPNFNLNVLLHIFAFVRNNAETVVVFDKTLLNAERKAIHQWVNDVINDEGDGYDEISPEELEVVKLIREHNNYVLHTQSEGKMPFRELTIFKEAPTHVYLITPNDLRDEINTDDSDKSEYETVAIDGDCAPSGGDEKEKGSDAKREDANCIKGSIEDKELAPYDKLIEYFIEFSKEQDYTEFRFLGLYNANEMDALNEFWRNIFMYLNRDMTSIDTRYLPALTNEEISFTVNQDCNGYDVIYKHVKDSRQ
ncbi:uncharacterized protein LOC113516135 [Galleria mellonella]|uniref:Uncharacterized protein LOC113516135 n=1 Tax=Galleria mellonella TaxID=7137 RepID=A0ABM3MSL0_GALME|nr:uncharacterized protein LOC113516135 [Galleria mellonella]